LGATGQSRERLARVFQKSHFASAASAVKPHRQAESSVGRREAPLRRRPGRFPGNFFKPQGGLPRSANLPAFNRPIWIKKERILRGPRSRAVGAHRCITGGPRLRKLWKEINWPLRQKLLLNTNGGRVTKGDGPLHRRASSSIIRGRRDYARRSVSGAVIVKKLRGASPNGNWDCIPQLERPCLRHASLADAPTSAPFRNSLRATSSLSQHAEIPPTPPSAADGYYGTRRHRAPPGLLLALFQLPRKK